MSSLIITLVVLLLFPGLAHAGPPLLTSDTGTPGDGHWEINVGLSLEQSLSGLQLAARAVDVNYGLGERIQLKGEVPWIFFNPDGREAQNGIGNSVVGVKWRFLDEERHGISLSTYPQVEFNTAKSSVDKGLVDKGTKWIVPFEIERKIGAVNVTGELGYIFNPETENQWLYGLAFGYQTSDRIEWVGEIFGVTASNFDWETHDLVFNLGFRLKLNQWLNLNASAGRSLHSVNGNEKNLISYIGLQFVF